jgi:hypothetical protein
MTPLPEQEKKMVEPITLDDLCPVHDLGTGLKCECVSEYKQGRSDLLKEVCDFLKMQEYINPLVMAEELKKKFGDGL